jgi:hypothetical protein
MKRKRVLHKAFEKNLAFFDDLIANFETGGEDYGNQKRNSLKLFEYDGWTLNVKSFKVPNVFNRIAYKFFRKSKAQRSYEYANKLIDLGIETPQPVAFYEFFTVLFFRKSYYISEHLNYDLTYRELIHQPDYPNHEKILRSFTRFTHSLHKKGVQFLDHSPGNTLIVERDESYGFYLVDLNRMNFKALSFEERMRNFSRLTPKKEMVEIMADEYSNCSGLNANDVFEKMWFYTEKFQKRFHGKKALKRKLKFWKNH